MSSVRAKLVLKMMKKGLDLNKPLQEIRDDFNQLSTKVTLPKSVRVESIRIGHMNAEWYIPENACGEKVIYYIHGGGFCLGIFDATRNHAARIANMVNKRVLLIDYRLAPENPYPAGINDTIMGYKWLLDQGYSAGSIGMYGESSGCSLILSTLLTLRDQKAVQPAAVVYATPFLDASLTSESVRDKADIDPYYADDKYIISHHYSKGHDRKSSKISPIYAELHDLPPFLIHAAEHDMLMDDAVNFHNKVQGAKGNSDMKVWSGLWHSFHMNADLIPEGKKALKEFGDFFDQHMS